MLAALDPLSILLGAAATIVLIGAVLGALGQIGRAWSWVMQRVRPAAPSIEIEGMGGTHSQKRDEETREITWVDVRPAFRVVNNEPVSVYAVSAGVVDPVSGERSPHPQRVQVLKGESGFTFAGSNAFQIPSDWLAGFTGPDPLMGVPYYVELTDSRDRKWRGVIDFREEAPRFRFRRVGK
jgi:hypothetical protein